MVESDGTRVRSARVAAGLTQRALAERSGIAQPHIARIESGRVQPTSVTLQALLKAARPSAAHVLASHRDAVIAASRRHRGTGRVSVFGSVARGEDEADSDIDLVVEFESGADLFDVVALELELVDLLGRDVDVISSGSSGRAAERARRESVPL